MALVVEDGSVVTGANSYVTVAEYKTWADARGFTYGTDSVVEQNILRAMDFLERQNFIGNKANENQPLQWPRTEALIDGYYADATEIPPDVKRSLYEATKSEIDGISEIANLERRTIREKIGDIEVQYDSSSESRTISPALSLALSKITLGAYAITRL